MSEISKENSKGKQINAKKGKLAKALQQNIARRKELQSRKEEQAK